MSKIENVNFFHIDSCVVRPPLVIVIDPAPLQSHSPLLSTNIVTVTTIAEKSESEASGAITREPKPTSKLLLVAL